MRDFQTMPSFAEKRYSFKSFKQQTFKQIAVKFTKGYFRTFP